MGELIRSSDALCFDHWTVRVYDATIEWPELQQLDGRLDALDEQGFLRIPNCLNFFALVQHGYATAVVGALVSTTTKFIAPTGNFEFARTIFDCHSSFIRSRPALGKSLRHIVSCFKTVSSRLLIHYAPFNICIAYSFMLSDRHCRQIRNS